MTSTQDHPRTSAAALASAAAVARQAARLLSDSGFDEQQRMREIGVLARAWLGWDHAQWLAEKDAPAPSGFADGLIAWARRRARHEPVAYILKLREFYGRPFEVTPAVLIPRPETEAVVDLGLEWLRQRESSGSSGKLVRLLDVGTGSGCLAITFALERPDLVAEGTDISAVALDVARRNAAAWGVTERVTFEHASLVGPADRTFDLIVANPPYVPIVDRDSLQPDVREFEPPTALFAGPDGLDVIRLLLPSAARVLTPGGRLLMEIGAGQAERVGALVSASGLICREIRPDLSGIPRVVVADSPGRSL